MEKANPAAFKFEEYKIPKFSFLLPDNSSEIALDINFAPSGKYFTKTGKFEIYIKAEAKQAETDRQPIVELEIEALFSFAEPIKYSDVPTFFYRNSIAIIYPYVRAFISTLTLQANIHPILLPVMNLSVLEKTLRENIVVIED